MNSIETIENGDRLLTPDELAVRLGFPATECGRRRVLRMARAKRIPAVRFNERVVRFHWQTVLDALIPAAKSKRQMGRVQ